MNAKNLVPRSYMLGISATGIVADFGDNPAAFNSFISFSSRDLAAFVAFNSCCIAKISES